LVGSKEAKLCCRSHGRGIVPSPVRRQAGTHWRVHQFSQSVFVQGEPLLAGMISPSSSGRPQANRHLRWLIETMEQQLRESTQNAYQLRARARKLRAEAELQSNVRGLRDAALVLADRYERAADTRPESDLQPLPELPEDERRLIDSIEQSFLEPTESKEQVLARAHASYVPR
jgi:hypothetical protein